MKKLSFKGIITLTISTVYILSVVILFFVFNSFYIKSVRGKFLEELKYSAVVSKQMLDEEKENLRRDAGMVARDSALEFSLNRGINMYSSIIEKDLKNISLKEMNKLSYIKMTNILNSKLNISKEIKSGDKILEVFDKNFILLGKSGEFQKNEVDTGKENYLTIFKESNDNNVTNLEPFGLITKKGDSFFVKGVDYIKYYTGINTMSLCEMKESPGYVVVSKRINQSMIDRIKRLVNKEIVLVYDNRVLLSTIFADNEFVINENYSKREKETNGNYYREMKIRDKKMGFEFFPIIDFVGKETGGYIGVGFYLSDLENLYSASIKRFIVFFIVFSILVIIILNVGLKYLFKPLDKVIKITQNISMGDYEIVRSNSDRKEIAMITDSMDAMAKSIEHRERELKYATQQLKEMNQNLEKTVESRTIELSDALEKLRKTQEEMIIKEKLMSVGKLAGGIAHELNSPLGAILTSIQLIKQSMITIKQNDLQCDICDSVEIIEEATLKSKGIIDKLLKRDSIYLETRISEIDVKRIILDTVVVSEFKYRFEEHNIGFSLKLEDNIRILANDILIMLVFLNIIENAAEAIIRKKNETKGLISIYSYLEEENVYIEIEDNGSGMDIESKKKVFDPFYTTKDVGALGLGMTTVYEIIRSHNGHISIESELHQGTKVILKFFII